MRLPISIFLMFSFVNLYAAAELPQQVDESVAKAALKMSELAPMSDPLNLSKDSMLHPAASHESWYLSGFVENEDAERFAYYFVVTRVKEKFSYFTQITSMQTGDEVYKSSAQETLSMATRQGINLRIGNGFLQYNDINDSWVFGVESNDGFNLRVESRPMKAQAINYLNQVSFYNLQSKRVNGQLSKSNKAEFVTATNAWISHQWRNPKPQKDLAVERLLCRFLDNQGVMMVRASQAGEVVFSLADLLDPAGQSHPVSQFSLITQIEPSLWNVKLVAPKMRFSVKTQPPFNLKENYASTDYYLGLVQGADKNAGSCMIIKENNFAAQLIDENPAVRAKGKDEATLPISAEAPQARK